MCPIIHEYARGAFSRCNPEARQDLIQEVIANALVAYVRLWQRGRISLAYPTVLAKYGIAQVRDGRKVGNKLRIGEVLSQYAQRRKKFSVESLDTYDSEEGEWIEAVVEDPRTPVFDQVWFRCDFPEWLRTLSRRNRKVALKLALGEPTNRVAKMFRLSDGRISQLRGELHKAWQRFHGEAESPKAVAVPA